MMMMMFAVMMLVLVQYNDNHDEVALLPCLINLKSSSEDVARRSRCRCRWSIYVWCILFSVLRIFLMSFSYFISKLFTYSLGSHQNIHNVHYIYLKIRRGRMPGREPPAPEQGEHVWKQTCQCRAPQRWNNWLLFINAFNWIIIIINWIIYCYYCSPEPTRGAAEWYEAGREPSAHDPRPNSARHPEAPDVREEHPQSPHQPQQPPSPPESHGSSRRRRQRCGWVSRSFLAIVFIIAF